MADDRPVPPVLVQMLADDIRSAAAHEMLPPAALAEALVRRGWRPGGDVNALRAEVERLETAMPAAWQNGHDAAVREAAALRAGVEALAGALEVTIVQYLDVHRDEAGNVAEQWMNRAGGMFYVARDWLPAQTAALLADPTPEVDRG